MNRLQWHLATVRAATHRAPLELTFHWPPNNPPVASLGTSSLSLSDSWARWLLENHPEVPTIGVSAGQTDMPRDSVHTETDEYIRDAETGRPIHIDVLQGLANGQRGYVVYFWGKSDAQDDFLTLRSAIADTDVESAERRAGSVLRRTRTLEAADVLDLDALRRTEGGYLRCSVCRLQRDVQGRVTRTP